MSCWQLNRKGLFALFLMLCVSVNYAIEVPIYDFSIQPYSQHSNDYFPKDSEDYSSPLITSDYQASQLQQFYKHYYATDAQGLSPWSAQMVKAVLPFLKKIELEIVDDFDNQNKGPTEHHYAMNFKEHDETWLNRIKQNMGIEALNAREFEEQNRAISVTNTFARALPDEAPDFFHFSLPGQGFPFDNLQESVVWAGTPLYIFSVSEDKAWSLVLTPDAYFAWVKSSDIAPVSNQFIHQWQTAAEKSLIAITETNASIVDNQQHFQFAGFIGAVFPGVEHDGQATSILIPVKNKHHQATIKVGQVNSQSASLMPLLASKKNMVKIIHQLQNRPYGWGGAFFYNDCSQEMKSIFAPFGIWLPRNSAQQGQLSSALDLSKKNVDERISALKEQGHTLMTLVYIGGHVMLYLGNKKTDNHKIEAMTYQNLWGLSPESRDKRYVVGQALFLPLLKYYPENPDVSSLANKSYFKLIYLDQLGEKSLPPEAFARQFTKVYSATVL